MKKTIAVLSTMFALTVSLSACDVTDLPIETQKSTSSADVNVDFTPKFSAAEAKEALKKIKVSDTEPTSGYNRTENFGKSWDDVDKNGCDTRNDILKRDLEDVKMGSKSSCPDATVMSGTLVDPYTGKTINFVRGEGKNQDGGVQIDHVVPLSYAWMQEADTRLTQDEREKLANDPENLLAADGPANGCKSDSGMVKEVSEKTFKKNDSTGCDFKQSDVVNSSSDGKVTVLMPWLPNESFRCDATQQFIYVLDKYNLDIKSVDKSAAEQVLAKC